MTSHSEIIYVHFSSYKTICINIIKSLQHNTFLKQIHKQVFILRHTNSEERPSVTKRSYFICFSPLRISRSKQHRLRV